MRHERTTVQRALGALNPVRTPFEHLAFSLALPPAVCDALGLLVLLATRPAASPEVAVSRSASRDQLRTWASRSAADREQVLAALCTGGPVVESGLVIELPGADGLLAASPGLVELIAGTTEPADGAIRAISTAVDASIGCVEPGRARRHAFIIEALEAGCAHHALVHFTGPRGTGRLRMASTIAALRGASNLVVVSAADLARRVPVSAWLDTICVETVRHAGRLVITNAELVSAPVVALLRTCARQRSLSVWTTSAASLAWSAASVSIAVEPATPSLRQAAWCAESARHQVPIEAGDLAAISALELTRTQIQIAADIARSTRTPQLDMTFASAMHELFVGGGNHGQ